MKGFTSLRGAGGAPDLRFHAILFVAALIATIFAWTRDVSYDDEENVVRIWDRDTTDVLAVNYRIAGVEVRIERRTDQAGDYLWGSETIGGEESLTTEFPVGSPGHVLLGRIAGLPTARDLGPLSTETMTRFGIAGSTDRLAVQFRDEQRELILGDQVYGVQQRYAYEPATGTGYVLPRDVISTLSNGQGAIRERWLHSFADDDVARVRVEVGGVVRTMLRFGETGEWGDPGSPTPDVAFGTFMQRVDELAIQGFAERPGPTARMLVRIVYLDTADEPLGFMELLRDDGREDDPYFIVTETTRVPAQAMTFLAVRAEEGLGGALSGAAGARPELSES